MNSLTESGKPARALEIMAALLGRRIGVCGFDAAEAQRISGILGGAMSLPVPFHERLIGEAAGACDGILVKLLRLSPEGMRAAATSSTPILAVGPVQALLGGIATAYWWPADFLNEPWSDAELLVRLYRLLESPGSARAAALREPRTEPLVLLADDDPELVTLVNATLRNDGIGCRVADNGLTALRMARELAPDLVLLDVRMPEMDGFEVLETIRRDPGLQSIPVVLLTGCDEPTDVRRGSDLHADEYLGKPVSPNRLLHRVKHILSRTRGDGRWARSLPGSAGGCGKIAKRWVVPGADHTGGVERS